MNSVQKVLFRYLKILDPNTIRKEDYIKKYLHEDKVTNKIVVDLQDHVLTLAKTIREMEVGFETCFSKYFGC